MPSINRVYIYGYKRGSASVKALQKSIKERGYRVVRRSPRSFRSPLRRDLTLVWGASQLPQWVPNHHINTPTTVGDAGNKLRTFIRLREAGDVPIPEFTTDKQLAEAWTDNTWVVCRTLLRASGGKGIVLAKSKEEVVNAPLYVKYRRKQSEYRVHVFKGTIIDVQEKRRRGLANRPEYFDDYIRNHTTGWVFCRTDIDEPSSLRDVALRAVAALHLDFGAVDIIYNRNQDKLYVLEINTAPGLSGTTLNKYVEAILS